MSECEKFTRILDQASAEPSDELVPALLHALDCERCGAKRDLGELVPHDTALASLDAYAQTLDEGAQPTGLAELARRHAVVCDRCALALGQLLTERDGDAFEPDEQRLEALLEHVTAEFLNDDEPVVRRRAARVLRGAKHLPCVEERIARAAPSPQDYRHIALLASETLRQGPMSSFARCVRELTPFLFAHRPHLYVVEGSYQLIVRCGLLRDYPAHLLHCVAPGRLAGLIDLGGGLVGRPVAGMTGVFGDDAETIASQLGLNWRLDCVVYLIDPMDATSAMLETLALKRECAVTRTPFLDTYSSALEFFGLLGCTPEGAAYENSLPDDLRGSLDYDVFPHAVLALVAHDAHKESLLEFARENLAFLSRFKKVIGPRTTGTLLNGHMPAGAPNSTDLEDARARLVAALAEHGMKDDWVEVLARGREGGNLQIAESVAMGVCDSVILFEEPRPSAAYTGTHELILRSARIANQADRLRSSSRQMLVHDSRSASVWAELWEHAPVGGPVTLERAFRDKFGVELVLAGDVGPEATSPTAPRTWDTITEEAAWYLLSAVAMRRAPGEGTSEFTRVSVACGTAMRHVVSRIHDIAGRLFARITDHHEREARTLRECCERFPRLAPRIEQLVERRRLTLKPDSHQEHLWSIGPVKVAPIVGRFGTARDGVDGIEATNIAQALAKAIRGETLMLDANAFSNARQLGVAAELEKHWATTDVALLTCADLAARWFEHSSPVQLHPGMHDHLASAGAEGEVAGIYLDAAGDEVSAGEYHRNGMRLGDLRRIAHAGAGCCTIMIAGAYRPREGKPPQRVRTVLAAIRAGIVSALVSDPVFAASILRESARQAGASEQERTPDLAGRHGAAKP